LKALATAAAVLGLASAAGPVQAATSAPSGGTGGAAPESDPAPAGSAGGGAPYGFTPVSPSPPAPAPVSRAPTAKPKRVAKRRTLNARPVLTQFRVAPRVLVPGTTPTVKFLVTARTAQVRLRLVVSWRDASTPARVVDLGRQPAGMPRSIDLSALDDPALPEGQVSVRIAGRDTAGRLLRPAAHLSRVAQIQVRGHVFPLDGSFSYGGADASFGAPRDGHTHQGQDLLAAEGTPVVAVRSGTIEYVQYQAGGAGWYIVLEGDSEDYSYAYMHLKEGSITIAQGQHVTAGQRIAAVGHTGDAQGSHLHFEVWQGPWFAGGHAIDPLPLLQTWQAWSGATAT
jgi:Peptidase family M23